MVAKSSKWCILKIENMLCCQNDSVTWPPHEPTPREGIGQTEPVDGGMIVHWDVALDQNKVIYTLYYQDPPF